MIQSLQRLPQTEKIGNQTLFMLRLKVTVAEGSFLHVGGTPSPLTEKKQPVFTVDGQPVIPASSFKGALRHQVELLLIEKQTQLAQTLGLANAEPIKPCIPSPNPSRAEVENLKTTHRQQSRKRRGTEGCWIENTEEKVTVPELIENTEEKVTVPKLLGLCPACYFFGATGIEGFLRIPNFFPQPGEWRIDQTRIRIDRKSQTAAPGAIVTGEQVKPGSVFLGNLYIFKERHGAPFGRCREIGGTKVDLWLTDWNETDDTKRQLCLLNEILIPALNNVKVLGGQKSLGGGRVEINLAT